MSDSDRPQSPFAGMADFSVRTPLRVLSPDEMERMPAEPRLYLETEYHQGPRANFSSADLTGRDFSGLNLRGIKMDRALLSGARFHRSPSPKREPYWHDLTGGVLRRCGFIPGASEWGEPRFGQFRKRLPRQGRDGVRIDGQRSVARRLPASSRHERRSARCRRAHRGRPPKGEPAWRRISSCKT